MNRPIRQLVLPDKQQRGGWRDGDDGDGMSVRLFGLEWTTVRVSVLLAVSSHPPLTLGHMSDKLAA